MAGDELYSILAGTSGLTIAAVIALFLAMSRRGDSPEVRRRLPRIVAAAIAVQSCHFFEEWATGFHIRFPQLLGLSPWSATFFVTFNLFWIVVWMLSVAGLRSRFIPAMFAVWFLAIGSVANGVAHPVFALTTGGYFPGLFTSPLVGAAGFWLLRALLTFTQSEAAGCQTT